MWTDIVAATHGSLEGKASSRKLAGKGPQRCVPAAGARAAVVDQSHEDRAWPPL